MGRAKRSTTKAQTSAKTATKRKADGKTTSSDDQKVDIKKEAEEASTSDKEVKVVTFTGSVPIDDECPVDSKQHHVLVEQDTVYNAMLNQTNIGANNNKYYILQVIKHNKLPEYHTWFRWGRVGKIAGTTFQAGTQAGATTLFAKKFREKTGNFWDYRSNFSKKKGKYDMVEIDYGDDEKDNKQEVETDGPAKKPKVEVPSQLDKRVQDVISLIFNPEEWEASVKEMKFDVKKAPLGKLTNQQITAGYESLKKIEACIQKKQFGEELTDACSEFYTRIPHDFGMKRPPLIRTPQELKEKLQLVEALGDLQIAINILDEKRDDDEKNLLDGYYESLGCELVPLEKSDNNYKEIAKYVKNTHGKTHNQYALGIEDIFQVNRESDNQKFKQEIGTRMLLWHGSRLTNWCGILKQGLRIAPPEAPVTGYMFGKGVYFADMVSKSANYCFTSHRQPIGFLLVCEVALGNMNEKMSADYQANKLPPGKHSTKGVGRTAPNPKQAVTLPDGSVIPSGKPHEVKTKNACLWYNEYIVYDTAQIRPRFLVKAKFKY